MSAALDPGTRVIEFRATNTQRRFIQDNALACLWSARMGDGKSAALCWAAFYYNRANPGANCAMIRDEWTSLKATTWREWMKWFTGLGTWREGERLWTWNPDAVGFAGTVQFLGLADPNDAAKLQSRELAACFFDELAPAGEAGGILEEVFIMALSRLRQPGMKWYTAKAASNAADELHWSFKRFVDPGTKDWRYLTSERAENEDNLPPGYYERLKELYAHRPDYIRRFVDGDFGFQQSGVQVTPEFVPKIHIVPDDEPEKGRSLALLWDFGLTPCCIITQVDSLGCWRILDAIVGEDMGAFELINHLVKPVLAERYDRYSWEHIGDPLGNRRAEATAEMTAIKVIRRELGGRYRPGPVTIAERVEPLRWALTQMRAGGPFVRVSERAKPVTHALRGGWHYHTSRTGIVSSDPVKNHPDSDVGDAMGYGAAILFPHGQMSRSKKKHKPFGGINPWRGLGFERPKVKVPDEAQKIVVKKGSLR